MFFCSVSFTALSLRYRSEVNQMLSSCVIVISSERIRFFILSLNPFRKEVSLNSKVILFILFQGLFLEYVRIRLRISYLSFLIFWISTLTTTYYYHGFILLFVGFYSCVKFFFIHRKRLRRAAPTPTEKCFSEAQKTP